MVAEVRIDPKRAINKKVAKEIQRIAKKIGDTRLVNKRVSTWLARWVNENFRTEGGKVGNWQPFKYGGRRSKKGIDTTAQLLQDTGKMKGSFLPFHSKRFAGIGSGLDRAVYHDLGVPKNNLPARRLLPNDKDIEVGDAILKIYDAHVKKAIR